MAKKEPDSTDVERDPPGPADHGRVGGMATREKAPELTEPDSRDDDQPVT